MPGGQRILPPATPGARVDVAVARALGLGRREAAELVATGRVRVDGRRARKGDRIPEGATVSVDGDLDPVPPEPDAPLEVRLETPDLLVVEKEAGRPTAPLAPGERGTLASALVARYPELRGVGHRPREPGLVHRLDTGTSGLVVAARTEGSFLRLTAALSGGALEKRYLAIVADGLADQGGVGAPLGPDPADPRRVRLLAAGEGRPRRTVYRVLRRARGLALVELDASPAYRHQVRAHLASLGHPLIGDTLYGGAPGALTPGRHALHASYVAWAGDTEGPGFAVRSELPPDLAALLDG